MRFVKERSESQPHKYGAESHKRRWEWHGWSGDVYVRTRKCLPRGKSSSKIQVPMANNSFLKLALDSVGPFAFTSDPSLETNYHALNPKLSCLKPQRRPRDLGFQAFILSYRKRASKQRKEKLENIVANIELSG